MQNIYDDGNNASDGFNDSFNDFNCAFDDISNAFECSDVNHGGGRQRGTVLSKVFTGGTYSSSDCPQNLSFEGTVPDFREISQRPCALHIILKFLDANL